jgi:hypothetical protein
MKSFEDGYSRVFDNMGGILGTFESARYASNVESAVENAINALRQEAKHRSNVSEDYLKGWLAEQWHAETLKISGAARGRSDVWANVPGDNGPGDVRFGGATSTSEAQVKYFKTGEDTAKAISRPEYKGMDKVVPSDQVDDVKETASHLAQKNQMNRPEQAANYQDTADHSSDRLEVGNASSKPLAETQAKEMARDFRKDGNVDADKYGLKTESFVEWKDVAREAGQAALHAAIMSAALSAAPHIWAVSREFLETGQVSPDELIERGQVILLGAGTAGLRGGVAAGLTAACTTGLLGEALKSVSPVAIGMATTLTLNAMSYAIQLRQGRITNRDFAHQCLRDTFVLSTGMLGATIGQMVIPIPLLGALAGNVVGSTLGAVAFEGANQVMMGICVESGWTFFGMVEQDYTVPEEVLRQAGYDLFSTHSFSIQSFSTGGFSVQSFRTNSLTFTPVRRGLIACKAVGYSQMY